MILLAAGSGADLYSFYRRALKKAWEDGRITSDERGILSELSAGIEPEGVDRIEAREYFRRRWKEYSDSPPEQRLSMLETAVSFDPENDFLWSERSAALYQLGKLEEALVSADRCLSLSSGSSDAWFWKGSIHVRRGLLQEAAECFEDALEIDQDNELAWLMLGWTERAKGDLSKAKACYDRVLDLCPELSLGYVERGLTFVKAGDLESAQSDLMRALDLDPGNPRASDLLRSMGADLPDEGDGVIVEIGRPGPPMPEHVDPEETTPKAAERKVRVVIEEDDDVVEAPTAVAEPEAIDLGREKEADTERTPPSPAPPGEEPIPDQGTIYKWMRCPHCGDNIPLTTTERPLVITCKSCGAKGRLVR
jgi:tetratricopeptide (TPR) repeat protein